MRTQKYYLSLSAGETRLLLSALIAFKNKLLTDGRYTDAVDEVTIKLHR
jgi:hypothetical protein